MEAIEFIIQSDIFVTRSKKCLRKALLHGIFTFQFLWYDRDFMNKQTYPFFCNKNN